MSDCCRNNVVTIDEYLNGCSGNYPVSDDTMKYILAKTDIASGTPIHLLTVRERDMAEIELLRLILRDAGMTAAMSDANGTWSHKTGAVEMNSTDKKALKEQLDALLRKYGMQQPSIKFHTRGMRVWQG